MLAGDLQMCNGNPDQLFALTGQKGDLRILDDIEVVSQARRSLEAIHLIRLGARATLVCQLTGLGKKTVRDLYLRITGLQSPSGQVPFTDTWYLNGNLRMIHANVVWQLNQHFSSSDHTGPGLVIHVYQTYLQITDEPILTLTRAYFVPRLISINAWYEQSCTDCGLRYIGPPGNNLSICPACVEYFKHRCQSCGAVIENHPLGRRKNSCTQCLEQRKTARKRAKQASHVNPGI